MSVINDLWLTKFVRLVVGSYGNGFKDAHKAYQEGTKGGCGRLISFERFIRSTFLYWVTLPFIVIFSLPIIVLLLAITAVHGAFRFLIWIGISAKCMLSALWLSIEALALYIIASLLWWFFKCTRPVTLDVLWNACVVIFNTCMSVLYAALIGFVWYVHLVSPCWVVYAPRTWGEWVTLGYIIALIGAIVLGVGLIGCMENCGDWAVVVAIIGIVVVATAIGIGIVSVVGTPSHKVDNATLVSGYCGRDGCCLVKMSDGVQYSVGKDIYAELNDGLPHVIGANEFGGSICESATSCNRHITVAERMVSVDDPNILLNIKSPSGA